MPPEGTQYVHDVRASLAETFAWLRGLADSARNRDLASRFLDEKLAKKAKPGVPDFAPFFAEGLRRFSTRALQPSQTVRLS